MVWINLYSTSNHLSFHRSPTLSLFIYPLYSVPSLSLFALVFLTGWGIYHLYSRSLRVVGRLECWADEWGSQWCAATSGSQTRQLFSDWTRHIAFLLLFSNCTEGDKTQSGQWEQKKEKILQADPDIENNLWILTVYTCIQRGYTILIHSCPFCESMHLVQIQSPAVTIHMQVVFSWKLTEKTSVIIQCTS